MFNCREAIAAGIRGGRMIQVGEEEIILVRGTAGEDSWKLGHIPETQVVLALKPDQGFVVHMRCMEVNPKAVNREMDSAVYQDSCMECFLNLYPDEGSRYLNFEVNSLGTMLCQAGESKQERVCLRELGILPPKVTVRRGDGYWEVCYVIPFSLIQKAYGKERDVRRDFRPGVKIRGNFYKCGDFTEHPHYGSWKPVGTSGPDFHQPAFFGEIVLREGKGAEHELIKVKYE